MFFEVIAAFVGAATLTIVLGAPLASTLARPGRLFPPGDKEREARKPRTEGISAFTPLDLGPDPVKWPSQTPWKLHSTLKEPEWPSQGWNDEHFGKHWQHRPTSAVDTGFHAMADRNAADAADAAKAKADGAPAPETRDQQRRRKTEDKPAKPRAPAQRPATPAAAAAPRQPAPAPVAPARRPGKGPPDEAELEHLIATQGLAATVQVIMQRTGWEFREAAQYLAKLRKPE